MDWSGTLVNLFSELKRRGVFQVGMAYVVTSWLLVQVADVVLPAFEVPDWTMRAIIVLLAIGLPIALVVSWLFDLTAQGVVRTDDADVPRSAQASNAPLNTVIIAMLAAAVVLFALDKFVWNSQLVPANTAGKPSVAVLPFVNMTQDRANDAFAAGVHDDLLTQLSKISGLRTHSRTSVQQFAGTMVAIPEIARQLRADTILEGAVQRSTDRLRVNAQLIDGASDVHLWAETYDRQLSAENIFAIQSEIARAIATALRATLTPEDEAQLAQVPTSSLEAWEAYARGQAVLVEDPDLATKQFLLATELDTGFASAWAGLCEAELSRYTRSSDRAHFDAAESACTRALSLDDRRVEVHVALGSLYRKSGDLARAEVALQRAEYEKAERAIEQALALDDLTVEAKLELGLVYAAQNRMEEAEAELQSAEALAPGNWEVQQVLAGFYLAQSTHPERFQRSREHAQRAVDLRPDLAASWNNLGSANYMLNEYAQAAAAWQRSLQINPTRTAYTNTGLALYYLGDFEGAAQMQREAAALAPKDHRAWGRLADALRFGGSDPQRAVDTYAHAAELAREYLAVNDSDWRTLGHLSVYQAQTGDLEGAQQTITRALALSGQRSEVLYYLALVRYLDGDMEACLSALEQAVSQDREYRHLIANEPEFRGLADLARFQAIISG